MAAPPARLRRLSVAVRGSVLRASILGASLLLVLGYALLRDLWPSSAEPEVALVAANATVSQGPLTLSPPLLEDVSRAQTAPDDGIAGDAADFAPDGAEDEPAAAGDTPVVERLVAAGFSRARGEEIVRRAAELRLAAAYREYETTGTVRALGGSMRLASEAGLRDELGDEEFALYLGALGRPTRVVVAGVATASAAANAGLLAGDEIVSYAGERVFNLGELNALTARRSAGETVLTTVVRDGQPLELYVTGGPLGITPGELR
jgi:hypothetical protein